jgi:selenocysteine lyase/cysteine desulfurase
MDRISLPKAARIFDVPETANFLNLYPLEASLEYIERVGVGEINRHCRRLLERLAEALLGLDYKVVRGVEPETCSTILAFNSKSLHSTTGLYQELRTNHVAVSLRHGNIRVSPYLFNDEADIERLVSLVKERPRNRNT